ncbi:primary-amine oxidase [Pseudonocardia nigra]|uniref:primary-amine oxidase n=1 Tax=Pseudonocardia nigra TaxID=1921578 RepID=UPI001C5F55A9|nr:primary-amine oxidase [Pseudonocardia nigra]
MATTHDHACSAAPAAVVDHPLSRLTAEEIDAAREVLVAAGLVTDTTRFPLLSLEEPPKAEVLAFTPGDPLDRRVRAMLLDSATGRSRIALLSVTRREVDDVRDLDPETDGQPPILLEEFVAVDEIVKADPGWVAAMAKRRIDDVSLVCPCPLSAGSFDIPGERGKRLLRVLSFLQHRPSDHPWAHPIDGVVAYVDLVGRKVVELIDHEVLPVPAEEGNFDDPAFTGPPRETLRRLDITQPDGPSFSVDGDVVTWEGWTFRVGFDVREGLVLHQIAMQDRPIVYRASIAEMVVPYADPGPIRFWQNYFDTGEYLLGQQANSLVLDCDCAGEITYLDAVLADGDGRPRTVQNAICMHEEDFGVLWKHTDLFTGSAETRRQRRMVISMFVTVGNYDYGFYWYLYLDGTIEMEVKSTGVVFTSAYTDDAAAYSREVAPGLGAPLHQHLFSARLDMTVDGTTNAVDEIDVRADAPGTGNAYGNAFGTVVTRLTRESEGARDAAPGVGRTWQVVNPEVTNRLGRPVAYALHPQGLPTLLAEPKSSIGRRATFASRHLWVTRYDPGERYPAGDLVNQHPGDAGLPEWVACPAVPGTR